MGTYVIGDIHGCYNEFQRMLEKTGFSGSDRLILLGDLIERGPDSLKMLRWLENRPNNAFPIRGNHEEEFSGYVNLMLRVDEKEKLGTGPDSNSDTAALYDTTKYLLKRRKPIEAWAFDLYGTLGRLIFEQGVTLRDLAVWTEIIENLPYYIRLNCNGREYAAVHAGFSETLPDEDKQQFYLYAREDSIRSGGIRHGTVIAGHTPTVIPGQFCFTGGSVFRHYDAAKDCVFYDIDCGCALRSKYPEGRLACIRLEDGEVFYL